MSERCPQCDSTNITGRGWDTGDGDELQERYCFACGQGESRMRSQGGVSWYAKRRRKPRRETGEEQRLLAEIYAAPDDDGPRSIYADWLIEHDDPRGTFIALQLARSAKRDPVVSPDEQVLLDKHWRAWIGAPAALIARKRKLVEFERGFWSGCDGFDKSPTERPELLRDPTWSTVRRVALTHWTDRECHGLLDGPLRGSVRSFTFTGGAWFDALAAMAPPPPLEEIVLALASDPYPLPPPAAMPTVRRLGVHCLPMLAVGWLEHVCAVGYRDVFVRCARLTDDVVRRFFEHARRIHDTTIELQEGTPTEVVSRCSIATDELRTIQRSEPARSGFGARPGG